MVDVTEHHEYQDGVSMDKTTLMSIQDVAAAIKINPAAVRYAILIGRLPATLVGNSFIIRWGDVEEALRVGDLQPGRSPGRPAKQRR